MVDKELVHIQISKVVSAQKWRVIRMLTKVWEFSTHVSTIKEVVVLQKSKNVIKTEWQIEMDGIPIHWVEEDTLLLGKNTISFKAIEGDLTEFRGNWNFKNHPEGTEVVVNVYLSVGIPIIEAFANAHIQVLVKRNFELILEALESRLISNRYASFRKGDIQKVAGFSLIGHFYNIKHLERGLKMLSPEYKLPSSEFLGKLFDQTPSFKMYDIPEYKSKSGDLSTNGSIIICTFTPDMITDNIKAVYRKVVKACKLAEKSGVGIVTLGGFTSIVGEMYGRQITEEVDIPITTGNSYTSALAIEGVEKAAHLLGKELKDLKAVVVGGTGDIGSACSRVLAQKVKQLTITARNKFNLEVLYAELTSENKALIVADLNNEKAVREADIVIAAANASSSILGLDWFKPGAVICDLAYPKNISYSSNREDIFVFSGGLASVPSPIETGVIMGLPSANICYGCSCEAIVLALERRYENFSFGRGNITSEKMDEVRQIAVKHGFELAPFFWSDKIHEDEVVKKIKKAVSRV